jgi:acid phosphatase family membrane protein YuiD
VLNQVIGELLEGHPVSDVKLKEVLGHTPLQVRGEGRVLCLVGVGAATVTVIGFGAACR